jgi:tetratricopeptide (TPR) repeat protein
MELGQPRRALAWAEQIPNWRKGKAFADYALLCARRGDASEAEAWIAKAQAVAEQPAGDDTQKWQVDRIRATLARAQLALGRKDEVGRLARGLEASEQGPVDVALALEEGQEQFDQRMESLAASVKGGNLDQARYAIETAGELLVGRLADEERRPRLEKFIEESWTKLPLQLGVEVLTKVARGCLAAGDPARALRFVNLAQSTLESRRLTPEAEIPLMAQLAEVRHEAGERDKARSMVDDALAKYDAARDEIVDIRRAGALRPIAEAYRALGLVPESLTVYRKAVEEGAKNPNSRPRADDLCETCCSMALHEVPPDASLKARLDEIAAALGPPW